MHGFSACCSEPSAQYDYEVDGEAAQILNLWLLSIGLLSGPDNKVMTHDLACIR